MRALFVHDHKYLPQKDGRILSHGQFSENGWQRYLDAFDELVVLGRFAQLKENEDPNRLNVASRERVLFHLAPDSNNIKGFLTGHKKLRPNVEKLVESADAIILRGVSELGWLTFQAAQRMRKPIAMEVVADAFDDLWHHGGAAAKAYAPMRLMRARAMTGGASHLIYVTKGALQKNYPPNPHALLVTYASNVEIPDPDVAVLNARLDRIANMNPQAPFLMGIIGNLDHKLKGIDIAVAACGVLPANASLQVVGPGNPEPYKALRGSSHVTFKGSLPSGAPVMEWLNTLDLYIQPSRQEGLPRAVIEAMSQGLPVIASDVGGVSELIEPQWIVPPNNPQALAKKISALLSDPTAMIGQARINFEKAQEYGASVLNNRRAQFWKAFADYARARA